MGRQRGTRDVWQLHKQKRTPPLHACVSMGVIAACCASLARASGSEGAFGRAEGVATKLRDAVSAPRKARLTVCSSINHENLYVGEWVDHYARMGFTKIVLYADAVEDRAGLRAILRAPIRAGLVDLVSVFPSYLQQRSAELYAGVKSPAEKWRIDDCASWIAEGKKGKYGWSSYCQSAANMDCLARYGPTSDWITNMDVDEFLFPCDPAEQTLARLMASSRASADAYQMQCVRFGTAGHIRMPRTPQSVLATHIRRMPYELLGDPGAAQQERRCNAATVAEAEAKGAPLTHGVRLGLCEALGSWKHISRPSALLSFGDNPHVLKLRHGIKYSKYNTTHHTLGLCCNHYLMRNEEEALQKDRRNGNFVYTTQIGSPIYMAYSNKVEDKRILAFVPTDGAGAPDTPPMDGADGGGGGVELYPRYRQQPAVSAADVSSSASSAAAAGPNTSM